MSSPNATPTSGAGAAAHGRPRRRGADLRSKIADSTVLQAVIAGALSFTHIRDVAQLAGQDGWKSWAYPLSVDLITVAAYRKIKNNQDDGQPNGVPWTCFITGLIFSLGANIVDAIANAPVGAKNPQLILDIIVGMWPAAAFFGCTLLRHSDQPTEQPAAESPANRPTADKPNRQPADRRPVPIVQPLSPNRPPTTPPAIPVQPTGQPAALGDLGPRAATAGELPLPVWIQIGQPAYLKIKNATNGRPTETALQHELAEHVSSLIAAGQLPAAVGRPSVSTAKRIRRAIEEQHPELTARPRRLAIASA